MTCPGTITEDLVNRLAERRSASDIPARLAIPIKESFFDTVYTRPFDVETIGIRVVVLAIAPGAPTNPRAAAEHKEINAVRETYLITPLLLC